MTCKAGQTLKKKERKKKFQNTPRPSGQKIEPTSRPSKTTKERSEAKT